MTTALPGADTLTIDGYDVPVVTANTVVVAPARPGSAPLTGSGSWASRTW